MPTEAIVVAPIQPAENPSGLDAHLTRQPSPSFSRQRSKIPFPYPLMILALFDVGYTASAAREGQHIPAPLVTSTMARALVLIGIVGCSRRWRYRGGWVGMVCAISIGAAVWEACRGVLMRRVIPPEQGNEAVKGSFLAITATIASLEYLLFLLLVRLSPPIRQSDGTSLRLPTSRDAHLFSSDSTRSRRSGNDSHPSPARSRRRVQGSSALSTPARTGPSRQQRRASAVSWLAEQSVHNAPARSSTGRLLSLGPEGPSRIDPDIAHLGGQPGSDRTPATATTLHHGFSPRGTRHSDPGTGESSQAYDFNYTTEETDTPIENDETGSCRDDEDQSSDFESFDESDDPDDSEEEDQDDDADSASSVSESSIIDLPPPLQPSRIVPPSLSMNGGLSSLTDRSPILRPLVRRSRSARFLVRSWGSRGAGDEGSDGGDVEARAEGYGTFRQR